MVCPYGTLLSPGEHELPKRPTGNEPCGTQDGALARLSLLTPVHVQPSRLLWVQGIERYVSIHGFRETSIICFLRSADALET